jgi:hypothetical protein
MKINRVFLMITISGLMLSSGELFAQEVYEISKADHLTADSVQTARNERQLKQAQTEKDASRLSDAKSAQKETKAKARETRRIDREASSAAREARTAFRAEKKAQKARKDADRQSRKAVRAKNTSDEN